MLTIAKIPRYKKGHSIKSVMLKVNGVENKVNKQIETYIIH